MPAKKTIYTVAVSHLDTSWLWDLETSIREYIPNTLFRNFSLFDKYPDYNFAFEGTYRYELMEEYYPEAFEKLKEYIAAGRWVPVGSAYENGDVNTPSPEALFRNILYGNSYFRNKFGKVSNDIFLPDCFGFGWALPSIARHANLKGFSTGKLTWGGVYGSPFDLGRWFGVDGTDVYANVSPGSYSRSLNKVREDDSLAPKLKDNEKYGLPMTCAFYGTGDRGGAPGESAVKVVTEEIAKNDSSEVDVKSISSNELFEIMDNELSAEQKEKLPTWSTELLLTDHGVGSYTSRSVGKRWNKRAEQLADAAERSAVAAEWLGLAEYPHDVINTSWKRAIAHQFHDDITGTSFQVCYKRNWNDYMLSQNQFAEEYRAGSAGITSQMDTSFAKGVAVAVTNPLQAEGFRCETVSASVKLPKDTKYVKVLDAKGKAVPSQVVSTCKGLTEVAFLASVPSVGIAVYDVLPAEKPYEDTAALRVSSTSMENSNLRVMFNTAGDICEVFDKKLGINVLSGVISLALFDYKGSKAWPAWELTYNEVVAPPREYAKNAKIKILEFGPARAAIEITRTAGPSTFKQIVSLDANGDTVKVYNEVDWRSTSSLLKVVFPLAVANDVASYDLGLGVIERNNDKAKLYEVPAQMWADITKRDSSCGVSVLSDSRAGWDKPDDNTLRLTVVHTPLYSFRWECSQHLMDLGLNRFSFGIYSHSGGWQNGTQIAAQRFNQPMAAFVTDTHKGKLGTEFSFAKISNDGVIIRAIKKANQFEEVIVRFNEGDGAPKQGVKFAIGNGIESAKEVFASEEFICDATVVDGELVFDISAYEPKTFALTLKKSALKTKPVSMQPLILPYNVTAITAQDKMAASELFESLSIPLEIIPDKIVSGGVAFNICKEDKNAVECHGQVIALPEGCKRLCLLAASMDGDRKTTFKIGEKEHEYFIQDWAEALGAWDLIGLGETGYVKKDTLAWNTTHAHKPSGDVIAKQLYFFKYTFDIPEGVKEITLPKVEEILILAATASTDSTVFAPAAELFDSLEKRPFDYKISREEYLKARPSVIEQLLQKKVNRKKSLTIDTSMLNSTIQVGDVFAVARTALRFGR
ncbi:MAG: glycoside hydrolase family 38 C-terminal domain-containing protein [Eubacteriales bacterium]